MAHSAAAQDSPSEVPKRPKGILKNSNSFQQTSPDARISPTSEHPPTNAISDSPAPTASTTAPASSSTDASRPGLPTRGMSEKEIVQLNTELNAGGASTGSHRRTSSNARNSQSQMGGRMKIDEPKTPYAKHYDPAEDEAEMSALNAQELNVDELDMKPKPGKRESEIPGLDIGEPEMKPADSVQGSRRDSDSDRRVELNQESMDVDGGHHGEGEGDMSREELQKHRQFEEMRKKHYEMKNIKDLLGHPEDIDIDEDEEDEKK